MALRRPSLPTYETIAEALSGSQGSGVKLAGWTVGRAALMLPGLRMVGIPFRQAVYGSLAASSFISTLALFRTQYVAAEAGKPAGVPLAALALVGVIGVGAVAIYHRGPGAEKLPVVGD